MESLSPNRPALRAGSRAAGRARLALVGFLLAARPGSVASAQDAVPESPTVTLILADPSPVIGVTGETSLRIEVVGVPESPLPLPRVLASVGQIEDLGREGPTTFSARYVLPSARFPQPAILVAELATTRGRLRGWLPVRLSAAATPSLRTDPGAQVTLHVDDRDFGPQVAPPDGLVHIPVVVPPGVEFATARSVNQHGKSTDQVIDLRVPYSRRLLFVPPESLAAGEIGEVALYAVEASGRPASAQALVIRAPGSKVASLGSLAPGEARFLISAPTILREKHLRIEAQLKGQSTTRIATTVPLLPARATALSLEPEAPRLTRDGRTPLRVFVNGEDAFGNPVDASRAHVLVEGKPAVVQASDSGSSMVVIPPVTGPTRPEVTVEGVLDGAHAVRRVPVGARRGKPAEPTPAPPRFTLTPSLGVLWNLGALAGGSFFVEAAAYRSSRVPSVGVGLCAGVLASRFTAESAGGISVARTTTLPILVEVHQRFFPRKTRAFFAWGVGAGFASAFARLDAFDTTVRGHAFGAALEGKVESGFLLDDAHFVLGLRYLAVYLEALSSGDRLRGNTAGAVAEVGYRLIW